MVRVYVLLFISILFASSIKSGIRTVYADKVMVKNVSSSKANLEFLILTVMLVLFAGLRTRMNDTYTYLSTFASTTIKSGVRGFQAIDWSLGAHPLFQLFQVIVKTVFGSNGQWFLLCHSAIVVSSYLLFLKKYSQNFFWSAFTLLAFTVYAFSMAAMKQTLAIAVGIWAIPAFWQKKYVKAAIIIAVGMLIHQYVFILVACAFLSDGVWTKKSWLIVLGTIIFFYAFSLFVGYAMDVAEQLGKEYDYNNVTSAGVGIMRVFAYAIIPGLSFLARKRINNRHDPMVNMAVNASMVSFCFMLISFNGGAVLLGRIPGYFNVLTCLAVPVVLEEQEKNIKQPIKFAFIFAMLFFYYTYYKAYHIGYCGGNWLGDIYNHAPISSLF